MSKFKAGDKVRIVFGDGFIEWVSDMRKFIGKTVTISEVSEDSNHPWFRIAGHYFHWNECDAELIEQPRREFIVIHREGAKTIAELRHDREVIKSGAATCAPSDTFDFNTGAKLAFDRLMNRQNIEEAVKAWNEPAPQPAHRFKVGDRVVINETGKIGEVSAISTEIPFGCNILVAHENGFHSGDGFNVSIAKKEHDGKCEWFYPKNLSHAPAPEPPKFYTGKVVCVEWKGDIFRHTNAGRIAMVTNGISDYNGWNRMSKPFESFSDFCSANMHGVFHEIKE